MIFSAFWHALLWYCGALLIWFTVEAVAFKYLPLDWWFEYTAIDVVEPARCGEPIQFISRRVTRQRVSFEYNDVLYCRTPETSGKFGNFSDGPTSIHNVDIADNRENGIRWFYRAAVPSCPATCYLRSVTTLVRHNALGLEIRREHEPIYTEKFTLEPIEK